MKKKKKTQLEICCNRYDHLFAKPGSCKIERFILSAFDDVSRSFFLNLIFNDLLRILLDSDEIGQVTVDTLLRYFRSRGPLL